MRATWQNPDGFSIIWSISTHQPDLPEGAVGEYPSNQRERVGTAEPILSTLLKAKIHPFKPAFRIVPRVVAPRMVQQPQPEPGPSELTARPDSLVRWNTEQRSGRYWPWPAKRQLWGDAPCTISSTRPPEYELPEIKPKVWRRGPESRQRYGLDMCPTTRMSWSPRVQDLSGLQTVPSSPEVKNFDVLTPSSDEVRVMAASLRQLSALNSWTATHAPLNGLAPLKFLFPGFGIAVPDPTPLR
jgi:hypothetical protein